MSSVDVFVAQQMCIFISRCALSASLCHQGGVKVELIFGEGHRMEQTALSGIGY
jgi:hypothetical protein